MSNEEMDNNELRQAANAAKAKIEKAGFGNELDTVLQFQNEMKRQLIAKVPQLLANKKPSFQRNAMKLMRKHLSDDPTLSNNRLKDIIKAELGIDPEDTRKDSTLLRAARALKMLNVVLGYNATVTITPTKLDDKPRKP